MARHGGVQHLAPPPLSEQVGQQQGPRTQRTTTLTRSCAGDGLQLEQLGEVGSGTELGQQTGREALPFTPSA
jgi:hypothetical protein